MTPTEKMRILDSAAQTLDGMDVEEVMRSKDLGLPDGVQCAYVDINGKNHYPEGREDVFYINEWIVETDLHHTTFELDYDNLGQTEFWCIGVVFFTADLEETK